MRVCLYVPCGHLLGKDCLLGSRLWCLTVSLSLSHWYPGSGVVLDFISYLSYQLHCCTLPDKRCLSQVMITLHFLNDVANDAESTYESKMTS